MRADGKVLMVYEHHADLWNIPGGGADPEEDLPLAVAREVKEESGLEVSIDNEPFSVHDRGFYEPRNGLHHHSIVLAYRGRLLDETQADDFAISDLDEISKAGWFDIKTLPIDLIHPVSHPALRAAGLLE